MGSCTVKQSKIAPVPKVPKINKTLLKFSEWRMQEYLLPEIRGEIFRTKDEKAPFLQLETNPLYLKRRLQVQSI